MKNLRIVNYINLLIILFSVGVIILNMIQYKYFSQIVFSLAFLSVILLIINVILLRGSDKKISLEFEARKNEKDEVSQEEIVNKEIKEENKCLKLVEQIDTNLPNSEIYNLKFQKLAEAIQLVAGLAYEKKDQILTLSTSYALVVEEFQKEFKVGEGITGQVATSGLPVEIDIAEQIEMEIISGLGKSKPNFLYILPIFKRKKIVGVVEMATFKKISERRIKFLIEAFEK